ncbi:MAG: flavoprotein [Firmicutes bacterium]|nr:flavoprotein [Bacillota bacterium]
MQQENLVEFITQEVLRQLKGKGTDGGGRRLPKILALFSGGTIGLEAGLRALAEIQGYPAEVAVILSVAAEKVIGISRIREQLGNDVFVVTAQDQYPGNILREADVVVMPVLTKNTAAKLARTISDTMLTTLVLQALLLGKPVIMASNAANPREYARIEAGTDQAPTGLVRVLEENLKRVEGLGVRLVDVAFIAAEIKKNLGRAQDSVSIAGSAIKVLIDAAAVKAALTCGDRRITIPKGAIITPLAVDRARELGVELMWEQAGRS